MVFEDALRAMRNGYTVRRKAWPDSNMIWLGDGYDGKAIHYMTNNSINTSNDLCLLNAYDIAANDWEVIKKTYPIIDFNSNKTMRCNVLINGKIFPAEYEVENIFVSHDGCTEYLVRFNVLK